MTEHIEIPAGGPLTTAEAALLREWSSSLGRVSASFRVVWNGEPALAGVVQSGIALVRADDSTASGSPAHTSRCLRPRRTSGS